MVARAVAVILEISEAEIGVLSGVRHGRTERYVAGRVPTSGSFDEIVIAYPTDPADNFGVNIPMSVANDPLVHRQR